jgi:NADPH-dependent glutamate synthase beta subunit-like oxidoreductase
VAVEGRTHKPVLDHEKCETCGVCLQACPSEIVPSMRSEEQSLRGKIYEHSDLEPRLNLGKVFGAPRCQMACPIRQDVRGYMRLIAEGRYREALALIREVNPLPSVCGYVCHHPCEAACTRGRVDDPLSIRSLKRFLAEYDTGNVSPPAVEAHKNKKVVIVGSGPAGLTAAYELAKKGYELEIVESYSEPGGLLAWAIPKFRLPREVLKKDIDHIRKMGVQFRTNTCFGQDMAWDDLQNGQAEAVIVATGTQKSLKLRIKHEDDFHGYSECLAFLRCYNQGEAISLGSRVLVVGGGNAAVDSARSAIRLGATEVTIVYRRGSEEIPADKEEIDDALREGIRIQYLTAPVRTLGDKGRVTGLECVRTELKDADASGRRKPVPLEGSEFVLKADSIISAVGQQSDYGVLGSYSMDRESLGTTEKNVFVAGDFVNGPTTVVEAMASGKMAAEAVEQCLEGKDR